MEPRVLSGCGGGNRSAGFQPRAKGASDEGWQTAEAGFPQVVTLLEKVDRIKKGSSLPFTSEPGFLLRHPPRLLSGKNMAWIIEPATDAFAYGEEL